MLELLHLIVQLSAIVVIVEMQTTPIRTKGHKFVVGEKWQEISIARKITRIVFSGDQLLKVRTSFFSLPLRQVSRADL